MVIEHALLRVAPDRQSAFELAMRAAQPLIAESPGFQAIEVRAAVETPGLYLLLVRWDSIGHHRDGFRKSERYVQWRSLLHGFYEDMPQVGYFGDAL